MRLLAGALLLTLVAFPAAAQTGTITGTVTNEATGAGVSSATILLYNSQGSIVLGTGVSFSGVYTIPGLAAGTYYVRVTSGTFIGELFDNLPCSVSCDVTSGTPIPVTAGNTTSGVDFALVAGGRITGTITDATTGLPVNGVGVEAYAANGALAGTGVSAGSGGYSINSLPAGTYTVRTHTLQPYYVDEIYNDISCDDVGCPLSAGQGLAVTSGVTIAGVNFALVPALPQLRVMYLRPFDRPFRPDYYRAVQNAMYELRAWYEEQMSGLMYSMAQSRPEICVLPHAASYYPGNTRTKVTADALTCAPIGSGQSRALWVLYFDVEDACNDPGRLGVGGLGITWLGSGDMNGLIGAPVIDSCGQQFFQPVNRYIGGAGHEIGHGFGLQHPLECQQGLPTCDWGALMFAGYASYPNTYLRADEKVTLSTQPMFRLTNLLQNPRFSAGDTSWQFFAAPNPFDIVWSVNNGVLEFYRNPPPPNAANQAVVLQPTGLAVAAGTGLLTQFDLGNSSSVRKRIAVLVHDRDFSDLSVCTFWLPPFAPLQRYSMRTHTTEAWTNATISFYAATPGSDGGAYRRRRVSP
jgi:hypothetical protein